MTTLSTELSKEFRLFDHTCELYLLTVKSIHAFTSLIKHFSDKFDETHFTVRHINGLINRLIFIYKHPYRQAISLQSYLLYHLREILKRGYS